MIAVRIELMPALRASPVILARSVKKQAIAIFATVYSFRINHPLDLSSKRIISHLILYVNTFSYDFCFDSIISNHKEQFLSRASLLSSSRSRVRSSVRLQKRIYFTNFFGKTVLIDGLSSPYLNRLIISVRQTCLSRYSLYDLYVVDVCLYQFFW